MREGTRLNQRGLRFDVSGRSLNEERSVEENGIFIADQRIHMKLELESVVDWQAGSGGKAKPLIKIENYIIYEHDVQNNLEEAVKQMIASRCEPLFGVDCLFLASAARNRD